MLIIYLSILLRREINDDRLHRRLTWIPCASEMRTMGMRGWVCAEKFVMEGHRAAITEFEFLSTKIWKSWWWTVFAA